MEKLTKEKLFQILNEELGAILREEEPISSSESTMTDYSNLSTSLKDSGAKLDPATKSVLNDSISKTLENGRPAFDYNYYGKNRIGFIYYTDALATIAKEGTMSGSENARNALMIIFGPYSQESSTYNNKTGEKEIGKQKMSNFFVKVNRFAANHIDLKGKDAVYFVNDMNTDNLLDAFYKGFENALKFFNPEIKKSFNSFISTAIANAKIDNWRKQTQFTLNGEKQNVNKTSLDNPLSADDEDAGTLGDTISSPDMSTDRTLEKKSAKKLWNTINEFIKRAINFSFPDNPKYEQVYEMYTLHDMDLDEIAKALGIENGTVRIMKMRAEDAVQPFISDGTLTDFVFRQTGERIKNIPFVQGKGSSKQRFVFPRVKDSIKEGVENSFINIITLNENEFIFDTTSFYNSLEEPDYSEYASFLLKESTDKFSKMNNIYNKFKEINSVIKEMYDGNYNVDTQDLFEEIKSFVEESQRIMSALFLEVYKLENVAFNIHKEYPNIANTINDTVKPIIDKLEEWPNKLSFMLSTSRKQYNPNAAFGL